MQCAAGRFDVVEFCSMRGIRRWGRSRRTTFVLGTTALPRASRRPAAPAGRSAPAARRRRRRRRPLPSTRPRARHGPRGRRQKKWECGCRNRRHPGPCARARTSTSRFDPDAEDRGGPPRPGRRRRKDNRGGGDHASPPLLVSYTASCGTSHFCFCSLLASKSVP